jgi:hypothetical protein
MAAEDHAIVVGIGRYKSSSLADLEGPDNDAKAVTEWLEDPDGGDVPSTQVHSITSSKFPNEFRPIANDLHEAFEALIDLAEEKNPAPAGRRLYIFMAGHGFGPALREAALLMANAAPGRWGHSVCGGAVADHFAEAAYFEEIILLMDCCRDKLSTAKAGALPWQPIQDERTPTSRWIYGFATGFDSRTREMPIDGEVRGVFTTAVLDALSSGVQTSETLRTLVSARMGELLGPDDHRKPYFQPGPEKFELGSALNKPTLRITPIGGADGESVLLAVGPGGGKVLHKKRLKSGETWEVELESGLWEVFQAGLQESVKVKLTMGAQDVTIKV